MNDFDKLVALVADYGIRYTIIDPFVYDVCKNMEAKLYKEYDAIIVNYGKYAVDPRKAEFSFIIIAERSDIITHIKLLFNDVIPCDTGRWPNWYYRKEK